MKMLPAGVVAAAATTPAGMVGIDPPWRNAMLPPVGVHVVFGNGRVRLKFVADSSPVPGVPSGSVITVDVE